VAKLLPCKSCKGSATTAPNTRFPAGEPQAVGHVASFPLHYKCFTCKSAYLIGAREFAKLRSISTQELESLGFLTPS
jgi:hypothetical protein